MYTCTYCHRRHTHRPILNPHIVQQPLKPLTRLIRRPKRSRYLLIPLHPRFVRPIEDEERQDGVLQQLQGLEEQGPEERVEAGLRRLAVGVENPEGGVDTDPENVRARRCRS